MSSVSCGILTRVLFRASWRLPLLFFSLLPTCLLFRCTQSTTQTFTCTLGTSSFIAQKYNSRGAGVVQSVERPILDLGSGRDLTVREFEPHIGLCADGVDPAWDSVSPSRFPSLLACTFSLSLCLSLSQNK